MSNYVHLFSGSFVESNALTYELSKLGIQFIIKDQQNSANLAGFGIPNYLFSCEVFVKSIDYEKARICLLYTSPSPRDRTRSRMPSSA